MLETIKRGIFKKEIAKIELRDFEVSSIITNALLEKGFDLISEPIIDSMQMRIGERITIYKVEQR